MSNLTDEQLNAISIVARCCSAISLLGCLIIIVTFTCSRAFHEKQINRLVFYASLGNLMSDIATSMSRAYVSNPDSPGCQFQAMMIQWFLAADAGWILAMAINVYLTLYRQYDAKHLRKMEFKYILACYGTTFVPAFVFLFVKKDGHRIYGDATLWCWIADEFDVLRIAVFYGPVWVLIVITFCIYLGAGRKIFENRRQLRELASSGELMSIDDDDAIAVKRPDASVPSETAGTSIHLERQDLSQEGYPGQVLADNNRAFASGGIMPVHSRTIAPQARTAPLTAPLQSSTSRPKASRVSSRRRGYEFKSAAWAYTKCALLYFTGIILIWIPSSANRAYSAVHDGKAIASLQLMSVFVLPLQGFWNCFIYSVMSWSAYKQFFKDIKGRGSEMAAWMKLKKGRAKRKAHALRGGLP